MSDAVLSIAAAVVTAIASVGVTWGMMHSKIESLKDDQRALKERQDYFEENYVNLKQFESTIKPIQDSMRELQRDIKKILVMLSRNESNRSYQPNRDE
jgi:peptidoglycan hydrolase CwlO-like protein